MDKKYISSVVRREARPRSKRLRELGASGSSGSLGSVISGGDTIVASGSVLFCLPFISAFIAKVNRETR